MVDDLSAEEVERTVDAGALWRALQRARQGGDHHLVRAIENRMRVLGQERRFAHLSDDELLARIRGLTGNREPEDLLAYSPASGQGFEGAADTAALNRLIKADQHAGIEVTLAALLDEWRRRHPKHT